MTQELEATLRALNPDLDETNFAILAARAEAFGLRAGPRPGEFVQVLDGSLRRFAADWGKDIQITRSDADSSFYLGIFDAEFSGTHDSPILKAKLCATNDVRNGTFWFFGNNVMRAHNRIRVTFPCRVWRQQP